MSSDLTTILVVPRDKELRNQIFTEVHSSPVFTDFDSNGMYTDLKHTTDRWDLEPRKQSMMRSVMIVKIEDSPFGSCQASTAITGYKLEMG
jgi:hypothetical protein